jgi:hypothetical protein
MVGGSAEWRLHHYLVLAGNPRIPLIQTHPLPSQPPFLTYLMHRGRSRGDHICQLPTPGFEEEGHDVPFVLLRRER